ncbi:MAG: MBL fold metallo-hydrolase [Gemmatimonadota bacterium]
MPTEPHACDRRAFLLRAGGCLTHLGLMSAGVGATRRALWAQERYPVVAREPWGRLERVADRIWALISTPLDGDRTTLCNGGIVAGRAGVLVVEAFGSDEGARWLARQARELTGRWPTHVVVTHYHADHTGGLRGALERSDVTLLTSEPTRALILERNQDAPANLLARAQVLDTRRPTEIDLGDRSVVAVPRRGHTDSDVSLEVTDPSVVFCGDLVWNGMFPNYMDAIPDRLGLDVRLLRERGAETYVPGHGALAGTDDLERYLGVLDAVEAQARRAVERGTSAAEAAAGFRIPPDLGEWILFNPAYFERAIGAWMQRLGA